MAENMLEKDLIDPLRQCVEQMHQDLERLDQSTEPDSLYFKSDDKQRCTVFLENSVHSWSVSSNKQHTRGVLHETNRDCDPARWASK